MDLSHRVNSLKPSATLAVSARAAELAAKGVSVLPFGAGEPDFDTPEPVKRAAIEALLAGQTKYSAAAGDLKTREVLARKLRERNRIPNVTPDHVVITSGGKLALYLLMQALIDPAQAGGEGGRGIGPHEFLLPVPAWVSFDPVARLAGARVVELPTTPGTNFKITPEQLRAAITPRSRVLLLNTPSNPCGVMYTPDELRALAGVVAHAARTIAPDLLIVTDEMYERITFGEVEHRSIGSFDEVAERTISVHGMSKAYAMTGWRVGYCSGSGAFGLTVARGLAKLIGQSTTNVTTFFYPAIRAAVETCDEHVETMRRAFAARARLICSRIDRIPGLPCVKPTGAFFVFPDVTAHFGKASPGGKRIASANDFAAALLDEHHVAAVPGEDFGGCGGNHVRFSFACSEEQITEGMDRLGAFVQSLR